MSTCRSCGAEIIWVLTRNEKRMPLDAKPVPGLFTITDAREDPPTVIPVNDAHVSHFATCPNADEHRRG